MKKRFILASALVLASVSLSAGGCPQCKARQIQQNRQYNNQYNNQVQYQQGNRYSQGERPDQRDVEAVLDVSDRAMTQQDREILIDIRSKLQSTGLSGENSGIRITVNRGSVLINGLVRDDNHRAQIEGSILEVDGVKDVIMDVYIQSVQSPNNTNRAAFKSSQYSRERYIAAAENTKPNNNGSTTSKQLTDKELEKHIKETIKGGWFSKSFPNVTVEVNNGKVMLTGTVNTEEEKIDLENKVRDVKGVQGLTNRVTIEASKSIPNKKPQQPKPNQKPQQTNQNHY